MLSFRRILINGNISELPQIFSPFKFPPEISSLRFYPARGTKPLKQYLWDERHLEELTGGKYTHLPLRVNKLGGRNYEGRKINQHVGKGVKFDYFIVDMHRRGPTTPGSTYDERVIEVRRDPNRTPHIALLAGLNGKRWILATLNMTAGQIISTTCHIPKNRIVGVEGNAYPLGALVEGTIVNSIESYPTLDSTSAVISAGGAATIVRHQTDFTVVRMANNHEFSFHKECMATVGRLSHADWKDKIWGSPNMHRRFGYKMSSGLWHRKDGYQGRKNRQLPPVRVFDQPDPEPTPLQKFSLNKKQLSALYGNAAAPYLVIHTPFRF